jgi:hypothetical protein
MKSHTPGPWLVNFEQNKFDSRRSKVQVVDGSSASLNNGGLPLVLANVNAMPFNDESVPLANATLIASAPDLLAVLQQIADDVEEWSDSGDSQLFHERMHANAEDARFAISKAKGNL